MLILLIAAAFPVQGQERKNSDPFIEQGTILTGVLFGFTKADTKHIADFYNAPQPSNQFAIVGTQLDALYFVADHIGVGPVLSYQSLYTKAHSRGGYSEWSLKYGFQTGGYLPFHAIFAGDSRSQLFLRGGISWLKQDETIGGSYKWGYKIGFGTLLPVSKQVAVELALNYLARSEDITNRIVFGGPIAPVPAPDSGYPSPTHNTVWHKNLTLSVGFKVAL